VRVASAERTKLVAIVEHLLTEDGRALTNGPLQQWPPHVVKKLFARQDLRGKPAPELVVDKWLTDEPATRGKVVVIDFWATWCRPCAKVMPELSAWARELEDEVVIIGVSNENEATVRAFLRKAPAAYSLAIDERKRMYGVVGVQAIPHVLVISSDGIVRWQGYPLDKQDPLTLDLLRRIVALDAGARAPAERK
jgi:thiol-disulfide isomerase/thioredoxin